MSEDPPWIVFDRATVSVERRDGRWHVIQSVSDRVVRVGSGHRWRWQARRAARRQVPGYWARPARYTEDEATAEIMDGFGPG